MLLDKQWFKQNQSLLLWMANTPYGRDLLGLNSLKLKSYNIKEVGPNWVTSHLEKNKFNWTFTCGDFFSRLISTRWKEFCFYAQYYQNKITPLISYSRPYSEIALVATAYGPYSPASGTGGTSVDGYAQRGSVAEAFATIRAGAGNGVDNTGTLNYVYGDGSGVPVADYMSILRRALHTLDTSALPNDVVISAATWSLYGDNKLNNQSWTNSMASLATVGCTPASDNVLVNADYGQTGSTRYVDTDFSYASFSTSGYNANTFNATGIAAISLTGLTKIGNRFTMDVDNTAPSANFGSSNQTMLRWVSADSGSNPPKLDVTGTVPSLGAMMMMGV